jgi:hypothetical protein
MSPFHLQPVLRHGSRRPFFLSTVTQNARLVTGNHDEVLFRSLRSPTHSSARFPGRAGHGHPAHGAEPADWYSNMSSLGNAVECTLETRGVYLF